MNSTIINSLSITLISLGLTSTAMLVLIPTLKTKKYKLSIIFSAIGMALPSFIIIINFFVNLKTSLLGILFYFWVYLIGVYLFKYSYSLRSERPIPKISTIVSHSMIFALGFYLIGVLPIFEDKATYIRWFAVINYVIVSVSILGVVQHVNNKTPSSGEKIINATIYVTILLTLSYPIVVHFSGSSNPQIYTFPIDATKVHIWVMAYLILILDDVVNDYKLQSQTDKMTQLSNRANFFDEVKASISNNIRGSIIFCDLDYFKHINDEYGHDIGDKVIISFAQILQSLDVDNKLAARIGGEEFALFLPNTDVKNAAELAKELQKMTEATAVKYKQDEVKFTGCFGVTYMHDNFEDALKRADLALYQAKKDGRNRVRVFEVCNAAEANC